MDWVFDVEKNSVAGACARGESDRGIDRDVVALIGVGGLLHDTFFAVGAAVIQAVHRAGSWIDKKAGSGDDLGVFAARRLEP